MKRKRLASSGAALATLALSLGTSQALDVVDLGKAPDWYANEATEMDNGQPVKRVVFSTQAAAISMLDLDRILSAYGVAVVDAKRAPEGHMQETLSSDRGERVIVFAQQPKGLAPAEVDGILAAYGLHLVDPAKLPLGYGQQVTRTNADGKEMQEFVPGTAAYAISPAEWNQILSAYGR